jgi:hypothetical protein
VPSAGYVKLRISTSENRNPGVGAEPSREQDQVVAETRARGNEDSFDRSRDGRCGEGLRRSIVGVVTDILRRESQEIQVPTVQHSIELKPKLAQTVIVELWEQVCRDVAKDLSEADFGAEAEVERGPALVLGELIEAAVIPPRNSERAARIIGAVSTPVCSPGGTTPGYRR